MLSIQEMAGNSQLKQNLKETENYMEKWHSFDPSDPACNVYTDLKRSYKKELSETMRALSLREFATSTVLTTGSLGAGGLNYLVPTYVTSKIANTISHLDIAPLVAGLYEPEMKGDLCQFNFIYNAKITAATAGEGAGGSIYTYGAQAYMKRYTYPFVATNEMIEDNQYNLIEQAINAATMKFAKQANEDVTGVAIRSTGTTGVGTKQTAAAAADSTTPANIATITAQVACPTAIGYFTPDTLMITPEAWWDAAITTAGHPEVTVGANGYAAGYGALNVVFINGSALGTVATNRLTNAITVVIAKDAALGVARKNWLRIENYSDPVNDLTGAVLTGRQAVTELFMNGIGVLTEA